MEKKKKKYQTKITVFYYKRNCICYLLQLHASKNLNVSEQESRRGKGQKDGGKPGKKLKGKTARLSNSCS